MTKLSDLFLVFLNMSGTAGFAALFVMAARLALKRAPKRFSYVLWAVVLFRMLCPVSFSSGVSLFSLLKLNAEQGSLLGYVPRNIGTMADPAVNSGLPALDRAVSAVLPQATQTASVNPMQVLLAVSAVVWLIGVLALVIYGVMSYLRMKRKLGTATIFSEGVYESDQIGTAFVCGFFRPMIYIPVGTKEEDLAYLLAHERAHIRRRDHLVKPLAYLALCLHWFNPLVWVSFALMTRDMEMSCDEAVMRTLGGEAKIGYSGSLLSLSVKGRILSANPLAFGESAVKVRIKNVLAYKKPAFWIVLVAVLAVAGSLIALAANPKPAFDLKQTKAAAMRFSPPSTDLLEIGEAACGHYHEAFMGEKVPKDCRITGYKVNHVRLVAGDENEFCVGIDSDYATTGTIS
jgi:beta-lactamase regulating signal transducer with metallopeptidase domain